MANLRPNLDAALFAVLNVESLIAVAPGGVFNQLAPEGTTPPYVIFQHASKADDYFAFTKRGAEAVYIVKAVSRSPWPKEASTIDTQIDTLLQDATLTITGYSRLYCRRESDFDLRENSDGEIYQHIGGLYRVIADES